MCANQKVKLNENRASLMENVTTSYHSKSKMIQNQNSTLENGYYYYCYWYCFCTYLNI